MTNIMLHGNYTSIKNNMSKKKKRGGGIWSQPEWPGVATERRSIT